MKTASQRKNYLIALLIGALAVPLLALAANGLIEGNGSNDPTDETETTAAFAFLSEPIEKVIGSQESEVDHLIVACGPDGQALVDKELDETIDPIEQAALDALRPICDEAGLALPEAPVAAPVVQQVVVVEQSAPVSSEDDKKHEDEHEDHEDEDEEDEEDEKDDD